MIWLLWLGAGVAALGLAMLGWCIRRAARLRASPVEDEEARAAFRTLVAMNSGAVGLAFLGLALMVVGAIL